MDKVLITGANSGLGVHLVSKFISEKYKVDRYNSKDEKEKDSFGDRDYLPTIKIIGIK